MSLVLAPGNNSAACSHLVNHVSTAIVDNSFRRSLQPHHGTVCQQWLFAERSHRSVRQRFGEFPKVLRMHNAVPVNDNVSEFHAPRIVGIVTGREVQTFWYN